MITFMSKKYTMVVQSSFKVEYRAIARTTSVLKWL
jgi:hypothetical protein